MDLSLRSWLKNNNIEYVLHEHPAVFTVPEADKYCSHIPGKHIKNLFLRDKRTGKYYLITIPSQARLNLNSFRKLMKFSKIRFGSPEALQKYLGLTPGAVSPLGLINDEGNEVTFITPPSIWEADQIVAHPNINTESLELKKEDFHRMIQNTGNPLLIMDLPLDE